MSIIDPKGLFAGDRLQACSDTARLYWPYLFLGSNSFGRLELSFKSISAEIFRNFQNVSADSVWEAVREYEKNCLAIIYEVNQVWWCQFVTSEKYLPRYKTKRDEQSPAPSPEDTEKHRAGYIAWKKDKSLYFQSSQKSSDYFGNFLQERRGEVLVLDKDKDKEQELSLLSPTAPTDPPIRAEEFANEWNRNRGNLPKVEKFTDGRRKKVLTRIKGGLTLDRFGVAVLCCRSKPFLRGENDRGWTATFDWLIENSENVEKAINNPYGGGKPNGAHDTHAKSDRTTNNLRELLTGTDCNHGFFDRDGDPAGSGTGKELFAHDDGPVVEGIIP